MKTFKTIIIVSSSMLLGSLYATPANEIKEVETATQLTNLINNNPKVVIEFYNPSCPVCMAFKRKGIFAQTAQELPSVQFATVSTENEGRALHTKFHITATPTFIFFTHGHESGRFEGYVDNPSFTKKVEKLFEQHKK